MSARRSSSLSLPTAIGGAFLLVVVSQRPSAADERQEMWRAFEARERAAETASVSWNRQVDIPAEALRHRRARLGITEGGDVQVSAQPLRMVLSGQRVRYESWGPSFTGGRNGEMVPMLDAYDGKRQQSLTKNKNGVIKEPDDFDGWGEVHLLALQFSLRPLGRGAFGQKAGDWSVEPQPAFVDGHRCLVIARRTTLGWEKKRRVERAYLDPTQEYVLRRYETENNGKVGVRVDARYDRVESPTWVPSSWTATFYAGGPPQEQSENELTDVSLGMQVPDETFIIDFPEGADVHVLGSEIPPGRLVPRVEEFVVGGDGSLIPQRQMGAQETDDGGLRWPLIAVAIGTGAFGVALLVRRRSSPVSASRLPVS